ncbi:RIC1-domain-containing protein [Basidiobolus meristosporus CBS 931.73]|uniref:RIC1-domain-containing protein n=1 Tax=Basidiobolus meristosporus CBS 931.73 TaxID=1314790 RepID=A0A1Y1Z4W3_9FUNG|nr:RIC1-domain-containing protein [Basidiobolus meristosporus CBS 931.73]|eukprot:ORY05246.1 RIC1-domain-containing protein [Basidiobolus meristosporus CBS 931.73]
MYWVYGSAKVISNQASFEEEISANRDEKNVGGSLDESLLAIKRNSNGVLFATLTAKSLALWTTKPTAMVAKIIRTEESIEQHGLNQDVFWKPDSTTIVILTIDMFFLFYQIVSNSSYVYQYRFEAAQSYVTGPGHGNGIMSLSMRFRHSKQLTSGVQCAVPTNEELIVSEKARAAIRYISWLDGSDTKEPTFFDELGFIPADIDCRIHYIVYDKFMDIFCWIASNGAVYLAYRKTKQDKKEWQGCCLYNEIDQENKGRATAITVNRKFGLVAVGTEGGSVLCYSVLDKSSVSLSHTLFPKNTTELSKVTSLSWTSDGYMLAVGWERHGVSLWSVFGRLLFSTISEDSLTLLSGNFQDAFFHGAHQLFWSPSNQELFILQNISLEDGVVDKFYILPIVKSAVTGFHSPDNVRHALLQMDDRLYLYNKVDQEIEGLNPDVIWQTIQYPSAYISDNWPIKYVSISYDGKYVAIAGKHGVAHCNITTGRWKLFGDQLQEQEFVCHGGLVWYKKILIVACDLIEDNSHELRFYSRENNLDYSYMLACAKLANPVIYLSIMDDSLLVYTMDNILHDYRISTRSDGSLDVELLQQISFEGVISVPGRVQCITWLQEKPAEGSFNDPRHSSIIILIAGKLVYASPQEIDGVFQYKARKLSDRVEYFYVPNKTIGSQQNSLWSYDGQSFQVWASILRHNTGEATAGLDFTESDGDESFRFSLDFYPRSILLEKGIVIGLEQSTSMTHSPFASFKLLTKSHLFIHHAVRHFLSKGLESEAVTYALCYQRLKYFAHSLEVLLHQVLEDEADASATPGKDAELPSVVQFLNHFPQYLDVVVRCARKTEVALWGYLFSAVGNPRELFERCIDADQLKTATSYLIVLQTLEPVSVSSKYSVRLIQKAYEANEITLCRDLVRYLSSIYGSEMSLREAFTSAISSSKET